MCTDCKQVDTVVLHMHAANGSGKPLRSIKERSRECFEIEMKKLLLKK